MLRGVLPKGVLNTDCAMPVLAMKRTWSLVTGTKGQLTAVLTSHPEAPTADKLTSWFGLPVQMGSVPEDEKKAQASPAKMPTAVAGACKLPRNGRAGSNPIKLAQKLMS